MADTAKSPYTVYRARWTVLAVYSLITLVLQLQWLTFAPIAREAQAVYGVGPFDIDLLSLIFMLVFVVVGLPASWLIDKRGIRVGVGLGAVLTGAFGLLKGVGAASYATVVVAQVGLAVAQPLVINAVTKVAAQWFPIGERATAVGIATLAQFLGIIVAMVVTPELVDRGGAVPDLGPMLVVYGVISAGAAVLVLLLLRERPPTAPGPEKEEEHLVTWRGMRRIFAQRDMRLIIALFFIGLGVFNAVSTCIDQLCGPKGLDADETGLVGGVMLIAGVVGAAILPALSDKRRKRRPFLVLAMALATPAIAALTLADAFLPLVVASAVLGVFLLGAGAPVGFQYAAEVSYPVAESLSQGVILLAGQVSGILFIVGVNVLGVTPMMWLFVGLMAVALAIAVALRESPRILVAGRDDAG
ncbi:MAG: MFS transporter [Deltaproteobacteria bacterium]|nr:MFS transporter [Deltaproteobacteria bacterium]